MKKKKWAIKWIALALLCFAMPIFTACTPFWEWFSSVQLGTIAATFDENTMLVTWNIDSNAVKYEVLVNQAVVETYEQASFVGQTSLQYDFTQAMTNNESIYRFYVKSYDSNGNYRKSQDFVYQVADPSIEIASIMYDNTKAPRGVVYTFSTCVLSWNAVESGDTYVVVIASGRENIEYIPTTSTYLNIYKYLEEDEVYMVNVGLQENDILYLNDNNQKYFSTENDSEALASYTENIFYLDGEYYDYYITDQNDLDHLFRFCYLQKLKECKFQCAENFVDDRVTLQEKLEISKDRLYETYAYDMTIQKLDMWNPIFVLTFNYFGQEEPSIDSGTLDTYPYPMEFQPYYESYTGQMGVDSFASDSQPITYPVQTTDQLYHVVESGARPKFLSTTSDAYLIYQEAKSILNDIISEEMTDYEKALSIFDWLVVNVQYDTNVLDLIENDGQNQSTTTAYNCFYLEGVFYDHVSVCDGYAKAYSLMCNMLGIDCARIVGVVASSNGGYGGHAWNKVRMGTMWYVVDITWTNFTCSLEGTNIEIGSHQYFMISDYDISGTDYMSGTHFASDMSTYYTMPATDTSLNYYSVVPYMVNGVSYSRYLTSGFGFFLTQDIANIKTYLDSHEDNNLEIVVSISSYQTVLNLLYQNGLQCIVPGEDKDGNTQYFYVPYLNAYIIFVL